MTFNDLLKRLEKNRFVVWFVRCILALFFFNFPSLVLHLCGLLAPFFITREIAEYACTVPSLEKKIEDITRVLIQLEGQNIMSQVPKSSLVPSFAVKDNK